MEISAYLIYMLHNLLHRFVTNEAEMLLVLTSFIARYNDRPITFLHLII